MWFFWHKIYEISIIKYSQIKSRNGPRMHLRPSFFKNFPGGIPPYPPRKASCLRHSPPCDVAAWYARSHKKILFKKNSLFFIFFTYFTVTIQLYHFFVKRRCHKNAFFFVVRGAKNAIFWYAGWEKSGRVGNPVKELEMKSSLSLY